MSISVNNNKNSLLAIRKSVDDLTHCKGHHSRGTESNQDLYGYTKAMISQALKADEQANFLNMKQKTYFKSSSMDITHDS